MSTWMLPRPVSLAARRIDALLEALCPGGLAARAQHRRPRRRLAALRTALVAGVALAPFLGMAGTAWLLDRASAPPRTLELVPPLDHPVFVAASPPPIADLRDLRSGIAGAAPVPPAPHRNALALPVARTVRVTVEPPTALAPIPAPAPSRPAPAAETLSSQPLLPALAAAPLALARSAPDLLGAPAPLRPWPRGAVAAPPAPVRPAAQRPAAPRPAEPAPPPTPVVSLPPSVPRPPIEILDAPGDLPIALLLPTPMPMETPVFRAWPSATADPAPFAAPVKSLAPDLPMAVAGAIPLWTRSLRVAGGFDDAPIRSVAPLQVVVVPEPASGLLLLGGFALLARRRR